MRVKLVPAGRSTWGQVQLLVSLGRSRSTWALFLLETRMRRLSHEASCTLSLVLPSREASLDPMTDSMPMVADPHWTKESGRVSLIEEEDEVFLLLLPVAVGLAEEEEEDVLVVVLLRARLARRGRDACTSCCLLSWTKW